MWPGGGPSDLGSSWSGSPVGTPPSFPAEIAAAAAASAGGGEDCQISCQKMQVVASFSSCEFIQ